MIIARGDNGEEEDDCGNRLLFKVSLCRARNAETKHENNGGGVRDGEEKEGKGGWYWKLLIIYRGSLEW